jgi:hypothetical protein
MQKLTSPCLLHLTLIERGQFDWLGVVLDHLIVCKWEWPRCQDVETTFSPQNRRRRAFTHCKLTSPDRPHLEWTNAANSVGWGWYRTTRLCERVPEGEWDTINNIFCTQKHQLPNEYSHLTPQNAVAASPIYSKAGPSGTKAGNQAMALNGADAAQKVGFVPG